MTRVTIDPDTGKETYRVPKGTPKQEMRRAEELEKENSASIHPKQEITAKSKKSSVKGEQITKRVGKKNFVIDR
jgi:hypothetical protein